MSEILLDFGKPLFTGIDRESDAFDTAVGIAITVWNISQAPEEVQDSLLDELLDTLEAFRGGSAPKPKEDHFAAQPADKVAKAVEVEAPTAVVETPERAHVLLQRDLAEGAAEGVLHESLDPGRVSGVDGVEHLADTLAAPAGGQGRLVGVVARGRLCEGVPSPKEKGDGGECRGQGAKALARVGHGGISLDARASISLDARASLEH
jgi:hypothetical protein